MGRNNEKLWRWARIIIPVIVTVLLALAATLYASGKFKGQITQRVDNMERTLLDVEVSDHSQDEAIVRLETSLDYILKSLNRIETKLGTN